MAAIEFGPFTLDTATRQLTREGAPTHLSPKAFELLEYLIQLRPVALSKADLQQRLWPETFVAEANLSNLIAEVRAALGDSSRSPQYVRTVHRFGYAFCATVAGPENAHASPPTGWLQWRTRRFPLPAGEHVVGRDAGVEVRIEAPTVSRRHARLLVTPDAVVLEDFGSKNGTFRGAERVVAPVRLADGDRLRIGSEHVVFHLRGHDTTETHVGTSA